MKRELISTLALAKMCGVSQGTVDRALHDRPGINHKTKEKILKIAKEYGYRPNIHARSIKGGRSMLVGVVIFDVSNTYFSELATAIEDKLTEMGYYSIIMQTHKNPEKERECIDNLYRMSVDGIVLFPVIQGEEYEVFLRSLQTPIITVGNRVGNLPYAGIDNSTATSDAVSYIASQGYRKIIYLSPDLKNELRP